MRGLFFCNQPQYREPHAFPFPIPPAMLALIFEVLMYSVNAYYDITNLKN
jgi:hypothetical protein